jgi:hypothetical protein
MKTPQVVLRAWFLKMKSHQSTQLKGASELLQAARNPLDETLPPKTTINLNETTPNTTWKWQTSIMKTFSVSLDLARLMMKMNNSTIIMTQEFGIATFWEGSSLWAQGIRGPLSLKIKMMSKSLKPSC